MPKLSIKRQSVSKRKRDSRGYFLPNETPKKQSQYLQEEKQQQQESPNDPESKFIFLNSTNDSSVEELKTIERITKSQGKRGPYNKTGRTTRYYREKKKNERDGRLNQLRCYNDLQNETYNDYNKISKINVLNLAKVKSAFRDLDIFMTPQINQNSNLNKQIDYENQKYRAVYYYFKEIIKGRSKIKASITAAKTAMGTKISKYYRPYILRQWAQDYLQHGTIATYLQGKHSKRHTILSDEDVQGQARSLFMSIKPEKRTLFDFCRYINTIVIPKKIGVVGKVSCSVLLKYMSEWGYEYSKHTKNVFFDGHESPDVIEYRNKWLPQMMSYKKRMETYSGENMEVVNEPILKDGQKKIVMVTHDQATFFSNQSKEEFWKHEDESVIRKKTPGGSVMVSEFQCQCHGTMRLPESDKDSRVYLKAGINQDGYWKSEDMVKQLKKVIKLYNHLHPNTQGLFAFDQSSNHTAYPPDALRVSRMNLKPSPLKDGQMKMRNGWYLKNNQRVDQEFYQKEVYEEANENGELQMAERWISKGVKQILEERGLGLWDEYLRKGKTWKFKCENKYAVDYGNCCPYHLLSLQPDFIEQRSSLQEIVEESGNIFTLYPKYHCELNWIERYWGNAKYIARRECDYSYKSLKENIPSLLDQASHPNEVPTKIRRFYGRCWRLIEAYSNEQDGRKAYYSIVKKYKSKKCTSHRRIGIHD